MPHLLNLLPIHIHSYIAEMADLLNSLTYDGGLSFP